MNFNKLKNKINSFLFEQDPENENLVPVKPKEPPVLEKPKEIPAEEPKAVFIDAEPKITVINEPKPEIVERKPNPVIEKKPEPVVEPYEFKGIISPFYGANSEKRTPIKHVEVDSKAIEINDSIISPFFGYDSQKANEKREDSKVLYRKQKVMKEVKETDEPKPVRKRRTKKVLSSDSTNVQS